MLKNCPRYLDLNIYLRKTLYMFHVNKNLCIIVLYISTDGSTNISHRKVRRLMREHVYFVNLLMLSVRKLTYATVVGPDQIFQGTTLVHYENTPIQIYRNFHLQKLKIFRYKNSDIFHISALNIDCGYSLEPPRRGGSNEYP